MYKTCAKQDSVGLGSQVDLILDETNPKDLGRIDSWKEETNDFFGPLAEETPVDPLYK